ncbi:MAG: hypothetical protein R2715_22210 [Ilumatobacteraceae bacterium]
MAFETITGYCWPQSATAGETGVASPVLPEGRPVSVEIARAGVTRDVVFSDSSILADHHPTARCGEPGLRLACGDESLHRRIVAFRVLRGADGDRPRRETPARSCVLRRASSTRCTDRTRLLALSTNTWHAYNDFGGPNLYTGGTQVSLQRPMSPGYLYKPLGLAVG